MKSIKNDEWRLDDSGRTLAFFSKKKQAAVSKEMIKGLRRLSDKGDKSSVRFCLNSSPEEYLQDMIIFEYKDTKCRVPHKHIDSNEAIHLIEGKIRALIFDDEGNLLDDIVLKENGIFAYRNAQDRQHLYFPLSEYIVFREVRSGKFKRENNVSPHWGLKEVLGKYLSKKDLECHNIYCKRPCCLLVNET